MPKDNKLFLPGSNSPELTEQEQAEAQKLLCPFMSGPIAFGIPGRLQGQVEMRVQLAPFPCLEAKCALWNDQAKCCSVAIAPFKGMAQ